MATVTTTHSKGDCYKYAWARFVAKKTLEDDLNSVKALISTFRAEAPASNIFPELPQGQDLDNASIADLHKGLHGYTGGGVTPPQPGNFRVGIVGAGVSGLFTALLFDWLNEHPKLKGKLRIDYDITEAADEARLGGRLYTHRFSKEEHDYYDVGAMRFPENPVMNRTFRLFEFLDFEKNKRGGLVPYYLDDVENVCPAYFNDVHTVGDIWKNGADDPYKLNSGLPVEGQIPSEYVQSNPGDLSSKALSTVIPKVQRTMDGLRAVQQGSSADQAEWALLMELDKMSVRQFFFSTDNGTDSHGNKLPEGPGLNFNTTEWLECATFGTGWYDQSLVECVMEELDFRSDPEHNGDFWCVDGGAQEIAKRMREKVKGPLHLNSQVTSINANSAERLKNPSKFVPMTLNVTQAKTGATKSQDYFAVFNSTTLGALQRMDLKDAGLLWGTKQAIRALGYGSSCKVAIKFKSAWWQVAPYNINRGGLSKTDLPLRVCVYPSYNIKSPENPDWDPEGPSVLLCSYTWGQDASRLGSLMTADSPAGEAQLKAVLLHNLALLHASGPGDYEAVHEMLSREYETHHSYDWYKDQNMSGAFAYFGPGQFSSMWQEIIKPNAFGQLYLIGEAASAHHGWIVGALESVVRAVYTMLEGLQDGDPTFQPYKDAMELLSNDSGEGLPFYPLPAEMPLRQFGTARETEVSDQLEKGKELTYPAAVAMLCQVESFVERWYEESKLA